MTIAYKVVKLAEGHLCPNNFAHRDEGDSNHGEAGEAYVRFGFFLCILFLLFRVRVLQV